MRETKGETERFGISMLCQQLGKESWRGTIYGEDILKNKRSHVREIKEEKR